jgi:hypothetical protein
MVLGDAALCASPPCKREKKVNTFTDFIAAGNYLARFGFTSRGRIIAHGASAGGMLMGAVANKTPAAPQSLTVKSLFKMSVGVSDFDALKSAIRWRPQSLIFCAFDLLHLNGKDFREHPLLERRAKLKELVPSERPFLFSEEFTGDADILQGMRGSPA